MKILLACLFILNTAHAQETKSATVDVVKSANQVADDLLACLARSTRSPSSINQSQNAQKFEKIIQDPSNQNTLGSFFKAQGEKEVSVLARESHESVMKYLKEEKTQKIQCNGSDMIAQFASECKTLQAVMVVKLKKLREKRTAMRTEHRDPASVIADKILKANENYLKALAGVME